MSTCPDADLYSAYVDGEVPSPWKEKLSQHLSNCPACRSKTDTYLRLSQTMHHDKALLSPEQMDASLARLYDKMNERKARKSMGNAITTNRFFHASIQLPLPALAAALVLAVCIPVWVARGGSSNSPSDVFHASAATQAHTISPFNDEDLRVPVSSMSIYSPDIPSIQLKNELMPDSGKKIFSMLNYARRFNSEADLFRDADIVIIRLPELTRFDSIEQTPQIQGVNDGQDARSFR